MQLAKNQFLDNVLVRLDKEKENIPFLYIGEDRGNLFQAVERAKQRISNLKSSNMNINQAMTRVKDLIVDLPNIQGLFSQYTNFSDIVADSVDQTVARYMDTAGYFGKIVNQQQQAAQQQSQPGASTAPGTAGQVKKKKTVRGPKVEKFQKAFNEAIKGTPYERAGDTLKVDGILGPNTKAAKRLVDSYGGMAEFKQKMQAKKTLKQLKLSPETLEDEEARKRLGLEPDVMPAPEAPPPAKEDALRMYKETQALLKRKYPRVNLKADEWRRVRNELFKLVSSGRYTPEQVADIFDVDKMTALRMRR